MAALLDGRAEFAAELVAPLISSEDMFVSLAGRIIAAIIGPAGSLAEFRAVATEAAAAGWPWLARVARSATAMADPDGCADAAAVLAECQEAGDEWGALVSGSLLGIGCLRAGVDGLGPLRGQARRVLGLLSLHSGQPVHEERLVATLWPDVPLKLAKRRLQVAVSSLRVVLRAVLPEGIVRYGNTYLLRLPEGSTIDVAGFAEAMRRWRQARGTADRAGLIALANRVLELYRGEL